MIDMDSLFLDVERYCAQRRISESYLGLLAANDGHLIRRLRDRRDISLKMYRKLRLFLEGSEAKDVPLSDRPRRQIKSASGLSETARHHPPEDSLKIFLHLIVGALCARIGAGAEEVLAAPRQHDVTTASGEKVSAARIRARAVYLLHTSLSIPQARLADLLKVSKQAISKSLPLVEDEMDDPTMAEIMASLDRLLRPIEEPQS